MTDCCNAIAANGEERARYRHIGLKLQGQSWSSFPEATRLHSFLLLTTIFLSVAHGKSRH